MRDEWLRLMDNVFSNHPSFLLMCVVAYCVVGRTPLLRCTERDDFEVSQSVVWRSVTQYDICFKIETCFVQLTVNSIAYIVITQRRSVTKSVGCFQRRLFVCLFVCQRDNFRTSKHGMMNLGVGALYKNVCCGLKRVFYTVTV